MLKNTILLVVCTMFLALCVVNVSAFSDYARATGKTCGYCHVDPGGGGPLTTEGQYYLDNGTLPPATPTPPTTLTATAVSSTQIDLTWADKSTDETGFKVERASSATGTFVEIAAVGANVTSYSNTSLTASTKYYYRVCATNAQGNSAYSNTAFATTQAAAVPPTAPALLTATAASSSQIDLSWTDNSTDETGFKVERASSATGTFTEIAALGAGVTTYSNTALTASTKYYYRVCAYNAQGNSTYTDAASATTLAVAATPPASPTLLTATAVSSSQIDLTWIDNSTDETGFKVERASSATGTFTEIAALGAGVTTYSNTALTASTKYYYRVCAYNAQGNSGYTDTASATTSAVAATVPVSPTTLVATAVSATQIDLSWTDNSTDETGFKVERASSATGTFTEIAALGAGVTTYSNTALTASTKYYYRVCAYNAQGNSGYTNTASATTPAVVTSPPVAPTVLSAKAASSTQINLTWVDNSTDEAGFKVDRGTSSSGAFTEIAVLGAGVVAYSNTGLAESTTYYYRVRAYNSQGNSSYTNTASATTISAPPPPPTVKTPTTNPDGGTFNSAITVRIECETDDATIHYTTNGEDPTESDPTLESESEITVEHSMTIKARAWKTNMDPSDIKTSVYTITNSLTIELLSGWNMVSVPLNPVSGAWTSWKSAFGGVAPIVAYAWNAESSSYLSSTGPLRGRGYWVKMSSPATGNIVGVASENTFAINIKGDAGGRWNMIGNPFSSALYWDVEKIKVSVSGAEPVSLRKAHSDGLLSDYAWYWDGLAYKLICDPQSYDVSGSLETLHATQGCWFRAFYDCQLILTVE